MVIDANILFASLIKESTTATFLFNPNFKLYCPEFILEEFLKYFGFIQKKMKRTQEEFVTIMHQLYQLITVIPEEEYEQYMEEAEKFSPDDKDVPYFALALRLKCVVWSNDAKLKEQNKVTVYNTKELLNIFG
ncbi:MAG: PIN domain-containing protein [Nanoarchaeota archaeon]